MEAFHYNCRILRVQFHCPTDAVCLLTGNQCGAAASEQIHNNRVRSAAVLNRITEQRDWLHGRMIRALFRFVEIPDRGLLAVRKPLVFSIWKPAV